jgi:hypothetical protein
MSFQFKNDEIHKLLSRTTKMVRDFLLEEVFHDLTPEQIANELGISDYELSQTMKDDGLIVPDAAGFARAAGLDIGLVIHDPGTGKEITFFAADNFGSKKPFERQTEEFQSYGEPPPLPVNIDGLDGIPVVNPRTVACDGDFDLDKELGEDIIEAEFQELTERDLLDAMMDTDEKCENCIEHERLPDSMLRHFCTEAGVICSLPEDPERPEDYEPLELMGFVDHRAQRAQEHSERLLDAAGLLRNHNED